MKETLLVGLLFVIIFSVVSVNALEIDVTAPQTNGVYEEGNSVPISLITDIPSVCRYNIYNEAFPLMQVHAYDEDGNEIPIPIWMYAPSYSELANDFLTSNYLSFTASIENLNKGYYEYFVTCQDKTNNNIEANEYISFNIVGKIINGYYDKTSGQCWPDKNHPVGIAYPINDSNITDFFECCFNWKGQQVDCNNSSMILYPEPLNITINSPIENNTYSKNVPVNLITNKPAKCSYQLSHTFQSENGSIGIGVTLYTSYYPITNIFSTEHASIIYMELNNYIGFKCVDEENNTKITERIYLNITNQSNTPICSNGQTKCDGQAYYICSVNNWQYQGLVNGQCGYSTTTSQTGRHSSSSSSNSNSYNSLAYASTDNKESQTENTKSIGSISLSNPEESSTIQSLFPFMLILFIVIIAVSLLVIKRKK